MIIDKLDNCEFYMGLNERIAAGLKYLKDTDLSKLAPGKYEIDGSKVYVQISGGETKPEHEGKWEGHRKYIDIQYVFEGSEMMGYANLGQMKEDTEYDEKKDIIFFRGKGDMFIVQAGYFALFTPEDIHLTSIMVDEPKYRKKALVKILIK